MEDIDKKWMKFAITLSQKSQGFTAENPNVGCVIVDVNGSICGSGFTEKGGRPHAETIAIENAGQKAAGGTLYVTLEPCSHYGKTPPCAEAIIKAGIKKVVIGQLDPDFRVNGSGIQFLKKAGLEVEVGLMQDEVRNYMPSFLARNGYFHNNQKSQKSDRPYITIKIAHSLDGFISEAKGKGGQISNKTSAAFVHDLRSRVDAVLISQRTALIDNPILTSRINGLKTYTTRIVLDRELQISESSMLVKTSGIHPLIIVTQNKPIETHWIYKKKTHKKISLMVMGSKYKLENIFRALLNQGIGHVLVEPGPRLLASLLSMKSVDEFIEIISQKKLRSGLSIMNTEQTVEFLPPSFYMLSKQFNLVDDIVKIWKLQK